MFDYELHYSKRTATGFEPQTARFEVGTQQGHQILGEGLLNLLRRISRQYVAFLFKYSLL